MKKNPIYKVRIKWYYAILCGLTAILDGLVMILSLGHLSTDLQLRIALMGARKSWCTVTPIKEKRYCKGCHAEVTNTMYCNCGDFDLLKSETLSEEEFSKMDGPPDEK